jgi:hypothetical protein
MSTNWFKDMQDMHKKYGVNKWMQAELQSDVDWRKINKFMQFRIGMMQEELDETKNAFEKKDAEEIVDGIIDLCVFAIGTHGTKYIEPICQKKLALKKVDLILLDYQTW